MNEQILKKETCLVMKMCLLKTTNVQKHLKPSNKLSNSVVG